MTLYLAHFAISYALPLLCGMLAGRRLRGYSPRWSFHLACVLIVGLLTMLLQYGSYIIVLGWQTGEWPQGFALAGLLYWFVWFALIAGCVTLPIVAAGYAIGITCQRRLVAYFCSSSFLSRSSKS